jgi:TonB family protein
MIRGFQMALVALCFLSVPLAAQDEPVYDLGPSGVSAPVLKREVKPDYTPEAQAAGIEGEVQMSVVVLGDGTVGDVKVTKSLDAELGLDDEAVKATRQWLFAPSSLSP